MATRYFCTCREPHLHPKATTNWQGLIPDSVRDDLTFHKLEELHYCSTCHQLRCPLCTETEIAYKYCPHCLRQMPKKSTYCEKSCFRCPVENCGGYMNVSSESVRSEDDVKQFLGKRFLFTCHICHWTYTTELITAPQSVASIIHSICVDGRAASSRFAHLKNYCRDKIRYEKQLGHYGKHKQLESPQKPRSPSIIPDETMSDSSSFQHSSSLVPLTQPLCCRYKTRCKSCRNPLDVPSDKPFSGKCTQKACAIDCIPRIVPSRPSNVHAEGFWVYGRTVTVLINVLNSYRNPINVTISTISDLDSFNTNKVRFHLPCREFKVGCIDENSNMKHLSDYVRTIPTSLLTNFSYVSRVELTNRPLESLEALTPEETGDVFRSKNGVARPIDSGVSWCTVAAEITVERGVENSEEGVVYIPLFMAVESDDGQRISYWVKLELPKRGR